MSSHVLCGALLAVSAACCMVAGGSAAAEAERFPGKPITIVVPYEAGGGGDVYSRVLQPFLSKQLGGTSIIVQNIPGAGGIVGSNAAYARPADGYTLVLWSSPGNELNAITGKAAGTVDDWVGLGAAAPGQTIVAVPPDRPWGDLRQMIADMRASPKKYSIGGIGPYGTGGIAYAGMRQSLKFDALWVPYKGTNDVVTAVLAGQIDVALVGGSEQRFVELMKGGKMKILGVLSEKPAGPYAQANIPTAQQQLGIPIVHEVQRGHVLRAQTPRDRIALLREAYQKAASDPEFIAQMEKRVGPYLYLDGAAFTAVMHNGGKELQSLLPALNALSGN